MKKSTTLSREKELAARVGEMEKLLKANKKANHLRDRLLDILSHDVHSPLRFMTMVGKSVLIKEASLTKEEIRDSLADINQSGTRILLLISNILKWVEYRKGNKKTPFTIENLHLLVNDRMEFFRFMADSKQTELINNIPAGLLLKTDKAALGIIIQNLLNNAVKFTLNGKITARAVTKDKKVYISITDSGKGMTELQIADIKKGRKINPNADTDNFKGSGLGWELVKELLKHLRGSFEISSKKGRGTKATIILPGK
ncbi:MAG: HAMP domain-containing sensor histidine kinase [Ferruginibacter sp.]